MVASASNVTENNGGIVLFVAITRLLRASSTDSTGLFLVLLPRCRSGGEKTLTDVDRRFDM